MLTPHHNLFRSLSIGLVFSVLQLSSAFAQVPPPAKPEAPSADQGQHDFDFLFGAWHVHGSMLPNRLSGASSQSDFEASAMVRTIWSGRANLEELRGSDADPKGSSLQGLTLRLYNPASRQWNLYFASRKDGVITPSLTGTFKSGRGEFFGQATVNGRSVMVRQVWSQATPATYLFEEALSDDGGGTWQLSRRETLRRQEPPAMPEAIAQSQQQHDFDFNLGKWKEHTRRLQGPLTGSTSWIDMEGVSVFTDIWSGAQLAELESDGPKGHLELLTLRLYNPIAHQWSLSFATSDVGILGTPATVGDFHDGKGRFYDQELFNGKAIWVRFTIYPISADACQSEQAFSEDGGKTWETNWINTYSRL